MNEVVIPTETDTCPLGICDSSGYIEVPVYDSVEEHSPVYIDDYKTVKCPCHQYDIHD